MNYLPELKDRASSLFNAVMKGQVTTNERLEIFKRFKKVEEQKLLEWHREGATGVELCEARAQMVDTLIKYAYRSVAMEKSIDKNALAVCAVGGYGRKLLSPFSDIDLLFLLPTHSNKMKPAMKETVEGVLYILWDCGFKVGQSVRSAAECIIEANNDQQNKTALMDARLIDGDKNLYSDFEKKFEKQSIQKNRKEFLKLRRDDVRTRHDKYFNTPFLQEPNVKESCGGLRDFHNIHWITLVKRGHGDLDALVAEKSLSEKSRKELSDAHDFLLRVRNELHYETGKASDILTLRLQGVVATALHYPHKSILRKTEDFMRDYYFHTRHVWQHTNSLLEVFQLEDVKKSQSGLRSFLSFRKNKNEIFDGFTAMDGRIYAVNDEIFRDDPHRLMRLFLHCQQRSLKLSPPIRKLVKDNLDLVDKTFRYAKPNRETFLAILERKGEVGRILRLMHRVSLLGKYLPEFGALDCLVQHEFFHRYTADEHTLRFVDEIDQLLSKDDKQTELYRKILLEISDPVALYVAIILHDAGRAENVREHIDGSMMLADKMCRRLQITGARRNLIMFLVDNHLTFWRTATTKNIEDPDVIAEFAAVMKTKENLDALLLFTYADSHATSPDAWTSWKESLMRQLHSFTKNFLAQGREAYTATLDEHKESLRTEVLNQMRGEYHPWVNEHFERMPAPAFSYRSAAHIVQQVRTVKHLIDREKREKNATCIKWVDHVERGFTEMIIAARDRPQLLEKICCAIAAEQINILSADFFTRTDGIVVDIFRICDTNFQPVSNKTIRKKIVDIFEAIVPQEKYDASQYLKRRVNFLKQRESSGISFPVRTFISNDIHPACTTVEIQALDRIGLLHDLFHAISECGLNIVHARINTEKGAAVDTLYLSDTQGQQIAEIEVIQILQEKIDKLISISDD